MRCSTRQRPRPRPSKRSIETLLAPERLNRLVEQQRRDPSQLGLEETLNRIARTVGAKASR